MRAVGFLIPGSIGVFEGGLVGIFALLGLESSTGLAFGVARRFREGVWILIGYICLAIIRGPKAPAAGAGAATAGRASALTGAAADVPSGELCGPGPDAPVGLTHLVQPASG